MASPSGMPARRSRQAGGHPGMLVSHVGDVLGIKHVPIEYTANGKRRTLKISDVGAAEIEAIEGQGGGDVTIDVPSSLHRSGLQKRWWPSR